ncbi:glycosyltransferase family 2 protein [Actinoplanes sp. CA-142083]|uniref:glycosyltransferase family 2 protein n=1 Tax=Actinoplanes sp. CA-142083 TaxID=3239903 RepID=UPI003D8F6159
MIPVRDPGGLPLTLRGLPPVDEVIVVSETPAVASPEPAFGAPGIGSPADVAAIVHAARPDARVLRAGRPGPGNALATGLAAARGDVIVTLNGDGSTDPAEIPNYVAALTAGADVAVGSRYRDPGRDLTGGRFRRWANVLLIWIVNTVFGVRRTDPGFGYAAFWSDAVPHLDLPDPSSRAGAAWSDGPELAPILSLRPSIRGLRVTEVPSVAYPRMSRPSRAERPGPRHWLRLLAREFPHRQGRHANTATAPGSPTSLATGPGTPTGSGPTTGTASGPGYPAGASPGGGFPSRAGSTRADGSAARTGFAGTGFARRGLAARGAAGAEAAGTDAASAATAGAGTAGAGAGHAASTADLGAGNADSDGVVLPGADRRPPGGPIWGPPGRRPSPSRDLWQAGDNPVPHTSPRSIANVTPHAWRTGYPGRVTGPDAKPRSAEDARPDSAASSFVPPSAPAAESRSVPLQPPAARREVGTKRRRIEGLRQRPDLRVINGEGTGGGRTRSGRLRPVPKENLGG